MCRIHDTEGMYHNALGLGDEVGKHVLVQNLAPHHYLVDRAALQVYCVFVCV